MRNWGPGPAQRLSLRDRQKPAWILSFSYFALAVILALLARLPYLVNPERMNSDHAFLGLQALRLLGGDFSLFLWGSEYQTSFEPTLAALFFLVFGSSFQVLQLVPLVGYFGCLAITFIALRREVSPSVTLLLCLPILFACEPFIRINVWPYRQWSIFFALLPLVFSGKSKIAWFLCGFSPFFSLLLDFFTIQFIVPLALYFWLTRERNNRALFVGALAGALVLLMSRLFALRGAPLAFSPKMFLTNIPLFFKTCLAVMAGSPYPIESHSSVTPESPLQWLGIVFFLSLLSLTIAGCFFRKKDPLVAFGSALCLNALLGFWGSSMASDVHSVRYLSPLLYAAPFGLLGFFYRSPKPAKAFALSYGLVFGVLGWLQLSPMTDGIRVVRDPGGWVKGAKDVQAWLKKKQVEGGYSEYWRAYQILFLYQESPLIIPRNTPDRYAPYQRKVNALHRVVELFTPEDRKQAVQMETHLRQENTLEDKFESEHYVALIRKR